MANVQYSRRECTEVAGIPNSVNNNEIEDKVLTVFKEIVCELSHHELAAYHQLKKNSDSVVVKLLRRKDCQQIMSLKKDLKKVKCRMLC